MPDREGKTKADEEDTPDTSLHAYKEGREEDIKGDAQALQSNDPNKQQQDKLEGEDELSLPHDKE
jgi:hypothetical protein